MQLHYIFLKENFVTSGLHTTLEGFDRGRILGLVKGISRQRILLSLL
jgi:hypothetical protein